MVKRRARRAKRQGQSASGAAAGDLKALEMTEELLTQFSLEELREFLEADLVDVPVDPEFKERLRKQLWAMVESRARGDDPPH
jgi:hypothetical protein